MCPRLYSSWDLGNYSKQNYTRWPLRTYPQTSLIFNLKFWFLLYFNHVWVDHFTLLIMWCGSGAGIWGGSCFTLYTTSLQCVFTNQVVYNYKQTNKKLSVSYLAYSCRLPGPWKSHWLKRILEGRNTNLASATIWLAHLTHCLWQWVGNMMWEWMWNLNHRMWWPLPLQVAGEEEAKVK